MHAVWPPGVHPGECQRRSKNASVGRSKSASRLMAVRPPEGGGPYCVTVYCSGGLSGRSAGPGVARASFALLEPVAVTVHLEDVDVVGEPVSCARNEIAGPFKFASGRIAVGTICAAHPRRRDRCRGPDRHMPLGAPTGVTGGR